MACLTTAQRSRTKSPLRQAPVGVFANTAETVIPAVVWGGGLGAALVIGAAAGLLPALRAARMSPTEALWSL